MMKAKKMTKVKCDLSCMGALSKPLALFSLVVLTILASIKHTILPLPTYYFEDFCDPEDTIPDEVLASNLNSSALTRVSQPNISGAAMNSSFGEPTMKAPILRSNRNRTKFQPNNHNDNHAVARSTTSNKTSTLPPFSYYMDETTGSINTNAQDLLDFVIVAFPKTGTTYLQNRWMGKHPEICFYGEEMHFRSKQNGLLNWTLAMERMYNLKPALDSGGSCQRAFKSPAFIRSRTGMEYMRRFFPRTKFVIALRHPVRWFESLYNYKIFRVDLLGLNITVSDPAENMPCGEDGVCVAYAKFHQEMFKLGLTPGTDPRELSLLKAKEGMSSRNIPLDPPSPQPIFLFEYSELHSEELRRGLGKFLGLRKPLDVMRNYKNHQTASRKPGQIDICEDRHKELRKALLEISTSVAAWIEEYFAKSPQVVTTGSNFNSALQAYKRDPCDEEPEIAAQ